MLTFLENKLLFRPASAAEDWQPAPIPQIEDVDLQSADGTPIHAWYLPHPTSRGAVLYFHGNAGNLSHRGFSIVKLREALGCAVLIVDYPGYGKSGGRPSEKGCYLAADVAYTWLTEQKGFAGENILLFGASLGGAVAVDLARHRPHRALVLIKTFTSAPDVGARYYPWLPVRWLMRNRFNSREKIKDVHTPVFVAHGDGDRIIPFPIGKELYEAANEPKAFLVLEGQDHNDRLGEGFFRGLLPFLREHAPLPE
ncbi:MAG: alpha/beta hydrolase [Gemmataceae bacterium]